MSILVHKWDTTMFENYQKMSQASHIDFFTCFIFFSKRKFELDSNIPNARNLANWDILKWFSNIVDTIYTTARGKKKFLSRAALQSLPDFNSPL